MTLSLSKPRLGPHNEPTCDTTTSPPRRPRPPLVLVVDGDLVARRKVARLLSPAAFVRTASTLADAQQLVRTASIAALVVEIELEDGAAFELIEQVRQHHGALPVLVVSATDNLVDVSRATQLSAAFVSKRASRDTLAACLATLVAQAVQQQDVRAALVARVCNRAQLTPAEAEALRLFAQLGERRRLAQALGIAETSVRSRVRGICRKLDIERLHEVYRLMLQEMVAA